ncbi:cell number regulator 11-like [Triticum dicoccoides]|uniref:cell number regulator 11-like n=1 Tax=Triticum dicoccoides TaxID=85692 RepID=UPI00189125F3|nr:cell number regulator 11-like [Triticum dicoccoides]
MVAEWSVGLFDCFGDFRTCCLTFWCPCVTFGRLAGIVDKGSPSCCMNGTLYVCLACVGCNWLYSCTKRSAMRSQYNLTASPCMDCCVHFFCESCALCQEYKELENRGFNMAKGWEGQDGGMCARHESTWEARDVFLEHVHKMMLLALLFC